VDKILHINHWEPCDERLAAFKEAGATDPLNDE
jgi:hypothetical protein